MSDSLTLELHNRQQAWAVIKAQLFPFLAAVLQGGGRWVLTVTRRRLLAMSLFDEKNLPQE